jgi:hypothetical protein
MFFAFFLMALNMPNGTVYVYHFFLPPIPQPILYYIIFHIFFIILIAKIVFFSKCPSDTFSNIVFTLTHFYCGTIILLEMHLYIMVVDINESNINQTPSFFPSLKLSIDIYMIYISIIYLCFVQFSIIKHVNLGIDGF